MHIYALMHVQPLTHAYARACVCWCECDGGGVCMYVCVWGVCMYARVMYVLCVCLHLLCMLRMLTITCTGVNDSVYGCIYTCV
jgi:hypothetical protein